MQAVDATASFHEPPRLDKRLLLGVGLLALTARLVVVGLHVSAPDVLEGHDAHSELIWIARNLAAGRGFASPFDVGDAPSAWLAPFVPALWALLLNLFGEGRAFLAAALGVNAVVSAGAVVCYLAMLPQLCRGAPGLSRRALLAIGLLFSVWPLSLRLVTLTWYYAWQELAMAVVCYGLLRWPNTAFAWRWTVGLALAGMAAAYINPPPLVLLPPVCVWLLWRAWGHGNSRFGIRDSEQSRNGEGSAPRIRRISNLESRIPLPALRPALHMAAVAIAILLAMLPWMVRCHAALGRWMPMRSSFGVELRQGNNPNGSVRQAVDSLHPALTTAERAAFDAQGEGRYTAEALATALAYMGEHPRETLRRTACRVYVFWCSDLFDQWPWQAREPWWRGPPTAWVRGLGKAGLYVFPLVAALATAWAGWWRHLQGRWLLGAMLLVYPIPYYLTHVSPEYAYAVQPYLLLYACAALFMRRGVHAPAHEQG